MLSLLPLLSLITPSALGAPPATQTAPMSSTHTIIIVPEYAAPIDFTTGENVCDKLTASFALTASTTVLCGDTATKDSVVRSVIAASEILDENDELLIVFVGLGYTSEAGNPALFMSDIQPYDLYGMSIELHRDLLPPLALINGRITIVIDALHSDHVSWQSGETTDGTFTVGPWAGDFPTETTSGRPIRVISATDGQYTEDDSLFSHLLTDLTPADSNGDYIITFGELETYLTMGVSQQTNKRQTVGMHGDWLSIRNQPLIPLPTPPPETRSLDLASLQRPALYGGLGLTAAGCTAAIITRTMAVGAYDDLYAGNYTGESGYNDLVDTYNGAAPWYGVSLSTCTIGLVLTGGSLLLGRTGNAPSVQITPTVNGLNITF
jgi:hypothetical protein